MHHITSTLLVTILAAITLVHADKVQVNIANGAIVGETITAVGEKRQLNRFLSIPYAQPPVGKLRFRRPVPITEKWQHPVEALQWPNVCVQNMKHYFNVLMENYFKTSNVSEDCLYLNIWSPSVNENEDKLRPVFVWIHGGGFFLGTSSFELYDGETLAAKTDAVVVTINYRLSALGFLYTDEVADVKGNQGFWDQVLALEWVQNNIRYFGGDPNAVTISGESAGSWSVSMHVLSPVSRRLYHNAIAMSGAILDELVEEPKQYVQNYLFGIRQVGCATEQDTTISAKVIECLEQLDADKVDQILYIIMENDIKNLPKVVVVDGDFLPAKPEQMLTQGNYKTDVNLLVSTVENEGPYFMASNPKFRSNNAEPLALQEAKDIANEYLENFLHKPYDSETLNNLYFAGLNDRYDGDDHQQDLYRKQVAIALGDFYLACPTLQFAKAVKRYAPTTATVYQWYYTAKLGTTNRMGCARWAGTCHAADLFPLFGVPHRFISDHHPRERDISNEVIEFITSFIRTGTPANNREWLPYYLTNSSSSSNNNGKLIAPYYEIGNNYRNEANYQFNLKQLECEIFNNDL